MTANTQDLFLGDAQLIVRNESFGMASVEPSAEDGVLCVLKVEFDDEWREDMPGLGTLYVKLKHPYPEVFRLGFEYEDYHIHSDDFERPARDVLLDTNVLDDLITDFTFALDKMHQNETVEEASGRITVSRKQTPTVKSASLSKNR